MKRIRSSDMKIGVGEIQNEMSDSTLPYDVTTATKPDAICGRNQLILVMMNAVFGAMDH